MSTTTASGGNYERCDPRAVNKMRRGNSLETNCAYMGSKMVDAKSNTKKKSYFCTKTKTLLDGLGYNCHDCCHKNAD
jgi:hypothetical protein